MARIARPAFALSPSLNMSGRAAGNNCQETPNPILEPAALLDSGASGEILPPWSISSCVSHRDLERDRLLNLKRGPPFSSAVKLWLGFKLHGHQQTVGTAMDLPSFT